MKNDKFIDAWGTAGQYWGLRRHTAKVHAYLMTVNAPVTYEDIVQDLVMSRASVSMSVRELADMGLVDRTVPAGDRKEIITAVKDVDLVIDILIQDRLRRELIPLRKALAGMNRKDGRLIAEVKQRVEQAVGWLENFKIKK